MKRKSSVSAEAVQPPLEPVVVSDIQTPAGRVSPIVLAVVDRVGPFAQSTAGKVVPLAQNAAGRVNAAAVLVSPYAVNAAGRIVPLAQTAAGRVTPLAHSAAERITPLAHSAAQRVGPYATQAVDRVTPLAQQAAGLGHQAVEAGQQAAGKVGPLVEAARGRVNDDYLPRINGVLSSAVEAPALVEATKRSRAAMAAARGELSLPQPKVEIVPQRSTVTSWLPKVAIVAGVAGLVAFLVKKLLGDKDADWQAARPTTPYAPSRPASAQPKPTVDSTTDNTSSTTASGTPAPNATEAAASADAQWGESGHVLADEGDVAAVDNSVASDAVTTETGQLDWDAALKQSPTTSTYDGEGVYVGAEPPQGFVIKGNERSMKYHTPESSGYSSTTAEVWFTSEEAAQQAGFSRAQG